MKNNTHWNVRQAIVAASISFLLATPAFASAALFNPPLGTSIINRLIERLCEIQQARGNRVILVDPARCLPPPPPPPMLTVTKVVVNDNGGEATVSDFTFFIDGATTTSGVAVEVSAGVHTVTENPSANYFATFSGDCAANGTVTLTAGESKECIITNNDVAPPLPGTLIVDKVTEPSGSTKVFDILATGTGSITGGGAGTTTDAVSKMYTVEAGTYSVTETVPDGWMQVSSTCTNVVVSADETETCTITNRKPPTLTVMKVVVNDDSGTATSSDFMIHVHDMSGTTTVDVAGSPEAGSATGTTYTVAVGPYHIAETGGPEGYSMTVGGDCAADGSITLGAGESKTCTVTNNDNPPPAPVLRVTKVVINDNGGTATSSDFTLHLHQLVGENMVDVSGSPQAGSASGTTYSDLAAGPYHVAENATTTYTAVYSGDCDASGNVTLAAGDVKACTITNDDVEQAPTTGHLIVNKVTQPGGMTQIFSVTATGTGAIVDGGAGTTTDATDKHYEVTAGTYSVAEADIAGWTLVSNTCVDVVVAAGETETCTITNAKLPQLTLMKQVVNDDEGTATTTDFQAKIDGSDVPWGVAQTVSIGAHTASETTMSGYTASAWSGDCAAGGTITLAAGDVKVCTITNDDDPVQAEGKLLISEVLYDLVNSGSQGDEPGNEWVEIHNGTNSGINLAGYVIHDAGGADALPGVTIPAGEFAIVTGATTTEGFWSIPEGTVLIVLGNTTIGNGLNNDGDAVWLESPASTTVDAVSWGDDTSAFSPAAPDVVDGYSLTRTPLAPDTDSAADWTDEATPTPGS